MIATPSIASLSRPTYYVPDVSQFRNTRAWQSYEEGRRHLQRPERAEKDFRKAMGFAIKTSRKDAASLANFIGVELGKGGHYREALLFFDRALELDPKDAPAWYNKGGPCTIWVGMRRPLPAAKRPLSLTRSSPRHGTAKV